MIWEALIDGFLGLFGAVLGMLGMTSGPGGSIAGVVNAAAAANQVLPVVELVGVTAGILATRGVMMLYGLLKEAKGWIPFMGG